jgi:ribonuclease HI
MSEARLLLAPALQRFHSDWNDNLEDRKVKNSDRNFKGDEPCIEQFCELEASHCTVCRCAVKMHSCLGLMSMS